MQITTIIVQVNRLIVTNSWSIIGHERLITLIGGANCCYLVPPATLLANQWRYCICLSIVETNASKIIMCTGYIDGRQSLVSDILMVARCLMTELDWLLWRWPGGSRPKRIGYFHGRQGPTTQEARLLWRSPGGPRPKRIGYFDGRQGAQHRRRFTDRDFVSVGLV